MASIEPYLSDQEVQAVAEVLYAEYPKLVHWNTDLLTTRIEPPWYGRLPSGEVGNTNHPVIQFVLVSDHPRPIQRSMGIRHATVATAWQQAFESSRKSRSHYVTGGDPDPLVVIFRMLLRQHAHEMNSLSQIINDAAPDPSKPKSALDAL